MSLFMIVRSDISMYTLKFNIQIHCAKNLFYFKEELLVNQSVVKHRITLVEVYRRCKFIFLVFMYIPRISRQAIQSRLTKYDTKI